jgi:hypothetical protein
MALHCGRNDPTVPYITGSTKAEQIFNHTTMGHGYFYASGKLFHLKEDKP